MTWLTHLQDGSWSFQILLAATLKWPKSPRCTPYSDSSSLKHLALKTDSKGNKALSGVSTCGSLRAAMTTLQLAQASLLQGLHMGTPPPCLSEINNPSLENWHSENWKSPKLWSHSGSSCSAKYPMAKSLLSPVNPPFILSGGVSTLTTYSLPFWIWLLPKVSGISPPSQ